MVDQEELDMHELLCFELFRELLITHLVLFEIAFPLFDRFGHRRDFTTFTLLIVAAFAGLLKEVLPLLVAWLDLY